MNKAEFIVYLMHSQGLTLEDATREADKAYANKVSTTVKDPKAEQRAIEIAAVEDSGETSIVEAEKEAQTARYPGQLRRIHRLAREKMRTKRQFERIKDFML